ncbi:hypothetical protein AAFF_G00028300 [Aldrovandia affinis]|uniref:Secreted protein n=1 Tax=Aldrovandia affinis TaxID=143900 RepID=A0AAD7S4H6_9TELE|nr:hypothetical protein AAFF_G00028300 [Aldrovandia affinis]
MIHRWAQWKFFCPISLPWHLSWHTCPWTSLEPAAPRSQEAGPARGLVNFGMGKGQASATMPRSQWEAHFLGLRSARAPVWCKDARSAQDRPICPTIITSTR